MPARELLTFDLMVMTMTVVMRTGRVRGIISVPIILMGMGMRGKI